MEEARGRVGSGVVWLSRRRTKHFVFWRSLPFVRPHPLPSLRLRPLAGFPFSPVMKWSSYRRKVVLSPIYLSLHRPCAPLPFDTHTRRRTCAHGGSSACLFPAVSLNAETFGLKAAVIFASDSAAAVPPREHECQDPTDTLAGGAHAQVCEQPQRRTQAIIQRLPLKFFFFFKPMCVLT